jgi:hypothetical protein
LWGAGGVFFEVTTKETCAGGSIDAGIRLAELSKRQAETAVKLTRQQVRFLTLGRSTCSQYIEKDAFMVFCRPYDQEIRMERKVISPHLFTYFPLSFHFQYGTFPISTQNLPIFNTEPSLFSYAVIDPYLRRN